MSATKENRYELLNRLSALLPAQFEKLLFQLDIPPAYLSGPQSPQSLRVVEVIRYLEQGDRLDELRALLSPIFHSDLRDAPLITEAEPTLKLEARPVRVFISYAERDRDAKDELRMHLKLLDRRGEIRVWDASQMEAGVSIQSRLTSEINSADIILLLLSADFLVADQLLDLTTIAMQRHKQGLSRVIPILLRPCDYSGTPLASLQALPRDGKAITVVRDRDTVWVEVIQSLRLVIQDLRKFLGAQDRRTEPEPPPRVTPVRIPESVQRTDLRRPISDVFRTTGTPTETFVEPARFGRLRIALSTMGKGLIVEGPSGIGKSVAVKKALEELGLTGKYTLLSSVHPPHLVELEKLLAKPIRGHLIIDDFHRLQPVLKVQLANLIKYLADSDERNAKLTLIGVNQAGMSLTTELPDLAGRIDIFALGRQPDQKIAQLIEKGERAANLSFVRRAEYVFAALGSFYTVQQLCLSGAQQAGIEETMTTLTPIEAAPYDVIPDIMEDLGRRFRTPLLGFTDLDAAGPRRGACLALLWLIRTGQNSCVLLNEARYQFPALAEVFTWLLEDGALAQRMARVEGLSKILFYDSQARLLSIEDPRLEFYLRNLSFVELGRLSGLSVRVSPEELLLFTQ